MQSRPTASEYASYYGTYIRLVPEGDLLKLLEQQMESFCALMQEVPESAGDFRYAPEKWTLKEVLGHLVDTERVMSYRTLCIARGEQTALPNMDEDMYVSLGKFGRLPLQALVEEFAIVRKSTVALLSGLDEEAWLRRGTASGHNVSVRALGAIIAGHELHHRAIIVQKYLAPNA